MAVGIYFPNGVFPPAKYDEAIAQLEAAGHGQPAGRIHHVAVTSDGNVQIFDVWESVDAFAAFGPALMPILGALGVDPGEPVISPVHNIVES